MNKFLSCLVGIVCLIMPLGSVHATTISQTIPFTLSGSGSVGITPFDQSLGNLDSVSVSIQGQLRIQTVFAPNVYDMGLLAPYSWQLPIVSQIIAVGGSDPEIYHIHGASTGPGGPQSYVLDYSYEFVFDHVTDVAGTANVFSSSSLSWTGFPSSGALINSMSTIRGHLVDFTTITDLKLNYTTNLIMMSYFYDQPQLDLSSLGTITLDYKYAAAPSPVPEPSTWILVTSGLLALVGFGMKRKK